MKKGKSKKKQKMTKSRQGEKGERGKVPRPTRGLLCWKKCLFSVDALTRTLALRCRDNISRLCDVCNITLKGFIVLPATDKKKMRFGKLLVGHCNVLLCLSFLSCMCLYVLLPRAY